MKTVASALTLLALPAAAQTTISPSAQHAYAANAGWIDCRPSAADGVRFTETYLAGKAYAANAGWISFGDGTPDNGHTYTNTTAGDSGVNLSPAGHLTGYAWCANAGWVTFEQTHGQPRLSFLTGRLTGHVWSANLGWLALDTATSELATVLVCPDTDSDGLGDAYEQLHFGSLTTATAASDFDGDGTTDLAEYAAGTDPRNAASVLRILAQSYTGDLTSATLTFTSTPGRLYRIEHSTDPVSPWTDSALGLIAPAAGPSTTTTLPVPPAGKRFFRAVAVRPLQP